MITDRELYLPIEKNADSASAPKNRTPELNLNKYASNFFYDYGPDRSLVDVREIKNATADFYPEYVLIGSGPGTASALMGILEKNPAARVWVFEAGNYLTQADYLERTPFRAAVETYRGAGFSPIINSPGRVTINVAPGVWGGGADVFSGTAVVNDPDYIRRMDFREREYHEYLEIIKLECNIAPQRRRLVSEPQRRFWEGAIKKGKEPFLLDKFGADLDEGRGRDYAGFKGRIPYMDKIIAEYPNVIGLANCRVKSLELEGRKVRALNLEFIGREDRRVLAKQRLSLPEQARVLLGAGSKGNFKILENSFCSKLRGAGVIHQYTVEALGLFPDEMPANGNPQAIGVTLAPPGPEAVVLEGAHPGRAVLSGLGAGPVQDINALREVQKRMGCMGVMVRESRPGRHKAMPFSPSDSVTFQRYTKNDQARMLSGIHQALQMWRAAGVEALALNIPVLFPSRDKSLRDIGFFRPDEISSAVEHIGKYHPQTQVFYRTGNLFGLLCSRTGRHPEGENLFVVSEDALPPGPGVNPTLGLLIQSRRAGRNIGALP